VNVKDLVAIDIHTHAETSTRLLPDEAEKEALEARGRYFRYQVKHPTIAQMAAYYRERTIAFVVFTVDHEFGMGIQRISNEEVAESAHEHRDICDSVREHRPGARQDGRARGAAPDQGFRREGFQVPPDGAGVLSRTIATVYPLYEAIAEARLPALFHSGQTGIGAGMPGGGGLRLKYSNPMLLDDVAAAFPDLTIVLAHPSFPWQDEALSVATHKPNVWIDLSGWWPKYFPPQLVQYANTLLKDRMLFGSDYPLITPERWMKDFAEAGFKQAVHEKILKTNAMRLLGLGEAQAAA